MKSNLAKRLLTCLLGIPALFALIFLLPMHNYCGISILVIVLAFLGSLEMSKMVFGKAHPLAFVSWLCVALTCFFPNSFEYSIAYLFLLAICWNIRRGESDGFKSSIENTAKLLLVIIYPSFFLSYLVRFFALKNVNAYVITMYLVLVFSNDIFAYVFGMLFGKNNKGIFKVSPKKSIAGFIGGFVSCIGICFLYTYLFKKNLPYMNISDRLVLGFTISIVANIGDLAESVFKRSANVKDSGNIIPGRGGVLDCVDSICATAPFVFYIFRDMIK